MLRAAGFVEAKFHGWTGYRTSNCTAGALLTAWKASMSSDEPTTGTTNPRILWLVVGHVVVGLIGALAAYFLTRIILHGGQPLSASFSVKQVCWGFGAVLDQVRRGEE